MNSRPKRGAGRRRVVVVGAGGFIGRPLCERLRSEGAQVVAATRRTPPLVGADGAPVPALREAEVVYYLATSVTPARSQSHPELVAADHEAFSGLLDALATVDRPPLVVLSSTGLTVCESGDVSPCAEDSPAAPKSAYAKAKLTMENELRSRGADVPGVVLRMTNVYGPGHRLRRGYGVVAHWLDAAARGRPLDLYGDVETTRDYVYIDDVVTAMAGIGRETADLPCSVFNIGAGEATTLGRLLTVIRNVTGRELTVRLHPGRGFDHPTALLDVRRARRLLGWQARTPLAAGLEKVWHSLVGMKVAS